MVPQRDLDYRPSAALSRRAAIASLGAGAAVAISGCSAATNRSVGDPEVDERDGMTIHDYYAGGDRVAEISFSERLLGRGYELEDEIERTVPGRAALESE